MSEIPFGNLAFFLFAGLTLAFGGAVAFSRNIIYSAFSLLGCFTGVAGIYVLLGADFLGVVQVFVYVGGITVLIIFAVMFTRHIGEVRVTNQSLNWKLALPTVAIVFYVLLRVIEEAPFRLAENVVTKPTTNDIGNLFLTRYLLPFELISLVLLVALVGAIVVARKEVKPTADNV